jgi:peptidoglycan/xylan/chitin deacetylase (PgdA/CDA1 family)/N-acetylmuramoyl-L-alanine amidase
VSADARLHRSAFARGACVSFRPLRAPNGHSVFLDPGHGGIDPGAAGVTAAGRPVVERQLTLAIALATLRLLRGDGFAVTVSRVSDTSVSRIGGAARRGGALTAAAHQRELRARIRCANALRAQLLLGIHFDSFPDRFVGGTETIYSPARSFAADSFRFARLVQHTLVARLRAAGWRVADRGIRSDAGQGRAALSAWERHYGHLLELGPARPPRFRDPTRMPGVIVEPLFISDPAEASIAVSRRGQATISAALATAVEAYFGRDRRRPRALAATATSPPTSSVDPLQGRPPRALIGRIPTTVPTRKHLIALTFDAGGNDAGLPKIRATLKRLHVSATFFMTGHFARFYPGWARRIAASYPIGNHTMNHLDLTTLSDARVRAEVVEAERAIRRITGRAPQPLFRFPYGDSSRRTLRIVNALGYAAVGWTADTGGWLGQSGGQSVAGVVRRALAATRPGAIILMHAGSNPHDGSTLDADALATIVRALRRRGYGLTTLPQAYAAAFPRWAAGSRRPQLRTASLRTNSRALGRLVRSGLPLYCGGSRRRDVALTFDDGPGPATSATLRLLRRFGERATFFLVGRNLREWARLPRAETALGAVGDHTWTHPFLTRLPPATMQREIAATQTALQRTTGAPVLLFRPPYGFHDAAVDEEVRRLGMVQVLWSLDSHDSYPPPGASAAMIVRTLARSLRPGSIVLLHENLRQTQLALPAVLRDLHSRHLESVSIPELLAFDPPTLEQLRAGIQGCPGARA